MGAVSSVGLVWDLLPVPMVWASWMGSESGATTGICMADGAMVAAKGLHWPTCRLELEMTAGDCMTKSVAKRLDWTICGLEFEMTASVCTVAMDWMT